MAHCIVKGTVVLHRVVNVQAVGQARFVVFLAVAGGRVDASRSLDQGDVVGQNDDGIPGFEGVRALEPLQFLPLGFSQDFIMGDTQLAHDLFYKALGQDPDFLSHFQGHVVEVGMKGDGQIGGQGPGGGGPDEDIHLFPLYPGEDPAEVIFGGELYVDGGGGVIVVLHLCFGQGRLAAYAPVNGFLTLVYQALFEELAQLFDNDGFIVEVHGDVGVLPVAKDPQAFELFPLDLYELLGVLPAHLADLVFGHLPLLGAQLLFHLVLNGQAVAVPTGYVGYIITLHGLGLVYEVLEDLVKGMADVDVAVGIGGAVVEDI